MADNYNPSSNLNDNSCIFDSVNSQLDSLNQIYESGIVNPIFVDLLDGWNMIGYTSNTDTNVETAFEFNIDWSFILINSIPYGYG